MRNNDLCTNENRKGRLQEGSTLEKGNMITRVIKSICHGLLGVIQRSHAGQELALQQLERCTAAGAAVGDLVHGVVLLACSGGVASADDRDGRRPL